MGYADTFCTMFLTYLYAGAIPMCTFLSIIGIALYYHVNLYNLVAKRSIKEKTEYILAIEMIN